MNKLIYIIMMLSLVGLVIPDTLAQTDTGNFISHFAKSNNPSKTDISGKDFGKQVSSLAKSKKLSDIKNAIAKRSAELKKRVSRITPKTRATVKQVRTQAKSTTASKGNVPSAITSSKGGKRK